MNYTSNELFMPKKTYTERGLVDIICRHFKHIVKEDNYFILSSDTEKIIGYSVYIKKEIMEKAVQYLKKRGYDVRYDFRTSGWGTFNAIIYKP